MFIGHAILNGRTGSLSGDPAALPAVFRNTSGTDPVAIRARMETREMNVEFSVSGTSRAVSNMIGNFVNGATSVARKVIRKSSSARVGSVQNVLQLVKQGLQALKPKKVQRNRIEEIDEADNTSSAGDSSVSTTVDLNSEIAKINSPDELSALAERVQARLKELNDAPAAADLAAAASGADDA